jgi:hypothetical protein
LIKRKIDENPRRWHTIPNEALWAYRMACHGATKVSPYQLVYNHDAILPWELKTGSRRVSLQDQLSADDYSAMMKEELEDLADDRLRALENIEKNKKIIAKWYDKKVKVKDFSQGDLVWKLILPIGSRDLNTVANMGRPIPYQPMRTRQCVYLGNFGGRRVC